MYKQDRATTERHARVLRELVKEPVNKMCADCKKNDARWASWNIGCFICIRCSGVHRSMGTHISKVKSVDLDTWTPEQMESIQKWGNHRANLYWEAHLRPGHIPPEHKMDSFIRSKYESRRWARDGPPPSDPSILEEGATEEQPAIPAPAPTPALPSPPATSPPPTSPSISYTSRQPQPHRLLSATTAGRSSLAQPVQANAPEQPKAPAPAPLAAPQNDLFSLDFHAPAPPAQQQQAPKKDVKNDILSLFSTPTAAAAPAATSFGQFATPQDSFGQWEQSPPQVSAQPPLTSMMGTNGTAMWGAQSGWAPAAQPTQNVWGAPTAVNPPSATTQGIFETQSIWGSSSTTTSGSNDLFGSFGSATSSSTTTSSTTQKKDDVFGDIWGSLK